MLTLDSLCIRVVLGGVIIVVNQFGFIQTDGFTALSKFTIKVEFLRNANLEVFRPPPPPPSVTPLCP